MAYRPYVVGVQEVSVEALELLREGVSGEILAKKLGTSRTAIWKFVRRLEDFGYVIEKRRGLGYRIVKSPDLSPYEVARICKGSKLIKEIYYYKVVDSTNERAKELGKPNVLFIAERQLRGRGRYGRTWVSEEGGLYFSITLPRLLPLEDIPKLTLTAGVALAKALNGKIKWPNDVLYKGKKLCGILCELVGCVENPMVVVGIGVNVNNETPSEGIALKDVLGRKLSRAEVLESVLKVFEEYYFKLTKGFWEEIREEWKKLSDTLGRHVRVETSKGIYEGYAVDIDLDGGLILSDGKKVYSGDCFYM